VLVRVFLPCTVGATSRGLVRHGPGQREQADDGSNETHQGSPMVDAYIPILIFILVAIAFGIVTLMMARLVSPQRSTQVKLAPYECGIEPKSDARDRYSIKYYLVAMLFVIFDVETVFMYPWAVILDKLAWFGMIEILVFLFILITGYFYAWREGALDWA
jgi:NADH-quinone oxidoreductase subunit A